MDYINDLNLPNLSPDLSSSYRRELVPYIYSAIRGSWSCAVVGVTGIGLSNLFRFISEPRIVANYSNTTDSLLIPVYLETGWLTNPRELYHEIIQQMVRSARTFNWSRAEQAAIHYAEQTFGKAETAELEGLLTDTIKRCNSESKRRIVIMFDEFDVAFHELPVTTLRHLRRLRDENKQALIYLAGTRRELRRLDARRSDSAGKFVELFDQHTYPLRPYSLFDAQELITRKTFDWHSHPTEDDKTQLYRLTGGHAKLLVAVLTNWKQRRHLPWPRVEQTLQQDSGITDLCRAIWDDLEPTEQATLKTLVITHRSPAHTEDLNLLRLKGLIVGHPAMIFATLFEYFVQQQQQTQLPTLMAAPQGPSVLREPAPDVPW